MMTSRTGATPSVRPGTSFRWLLLALVLGIALPAFGLAGLAAWRAAEAERHQHEAQILATSRALALAVDRDLGQAAARLEVLVQAFSLREGRLDEFRARAVPALPAGVSYALYAMDGTILALGAHDAQPPEGMQSAAAAFLAQVAKGGRVAVSPLFVGAASGQPRLLVAAPVEVLGETRILALSLPPSRLGAILRAQAIPEDWTAAVLDNTLRVVARSRREAEFIGQPARPGLFEMLRDTEGGLIRGIVTMDGMTSVLGAWRAPDSRFAVALAAPTRGLWQSLWAALAPAMAAAAALLLAALAAALLLGRRLVLALDRLGAGPGAPLTGTGVAEVDAAARKLLRAQQARDQAAEALRLNEERLRLTIEAFGGGAYECLPREGVVRRSDTSRAMLGEATDEPNAAWWVSRIHPEDRPVWDAARARLLSSQDRIFEARYRIRHRDGRWLHVWHRSLAIRDDAGIRRMVGAVVDVSAETEAVRAKELLAREMDHRVKNGFALVAGLVSAAAADHPEAQPFADTLRERIQALAGAHDLARQGGHAATLAALVQRLAKPMAGAVTLSGEELRLDPAEVQPLALVLHEWLTNSVKHGALSATGGRVRLVLSRPDAATARLDWEETGGPPPRPPERRGFGAELVEATITALPGGRMEEHWDPAGLRLALAWAPQAATRPARAPERG